MSKQITIRQSPWIFYEANMSEDNCEVCGNVYHQLPGAYYAQHGFCPNCLYNETGQEWESEIRSNLSQRDTGELESFEEQMSEFFNMAWFSLNNITYNENTKELWQH